MKTDVEELSPTRVKLSVQVPFEELKPNIDKAYREVARQIRVPGFRPGRVPPQIIDRRVGRGPVLEQAVGDAVNEFYGKAVNEHDVLALGQPDVEITKLADGEELTFTAEVDIRPRFELPDLGELTVTVDDAAVTDEDIEDYVGMLRERFASLKGVQRAAAAGDYVTIDMSATVGGEQVEDAQASGLSYEIGSGSLLDGLDDALTGVEAGSSTTFETELAGGEYAGQLAEVTVTMHGVRVKEFPELNDEFAQLASEFDTIDELREDASARLRQMKRGQQASQARDRAVTALVDSVDIPLPERSVADEKARSDQSLRAQIEQAGSDWESYLQMVGKDESELRAEMDEQARRSVKVGLVLDEFAKKENLGVDESELSYMVTQQAQRMGVEPQQLADHLVQAGQLGSVAIDVLRGKAASLLAERVAIRDEAGNDVDYAALARGQSDEAGDGTAEAVTEASDGTANEEAAEVVSAAATTAEAGTDAAGTAEAAAAASVDAGASDA